MRRSIVDGIADAIGLRRHRRLYGRFRNLIRERELEQAIVVGHALLAAMPRNPTIRRSLANCYARTGNEARAATLLLEGISPELIRALAEPIAEANRAIDPSSGGRSPWRLLPKGISNICVVDHRLADRDGVEYVTKVIRGTRQHQEVRFFEGIRSWSPQVARIAPRLLLCQDLPRFGMTAMTIEKVVGRQPGPSDAAEVLRTHGVLSRSALPEAHRSRLLHQHARDTIRRETSWRARRRILLTETLAQTHSARVNEQLMARLAARERSRPRPAAACEAFQRLRHVVIDGALHRWIDPHRDYTFVHGDFQTANLLVDARDGSLRVLDWESYRAGPPCVDLVRYFALGHTFLEFDKAYRVVAGDPSDATSLVRHLLVVYGLLVAWLDKMPSAAMETAADTHFLPAVERFEELAQSGSLRGGPRLATSGPTSASADA